MKYVRKLLPVEPYEVAALEKWFSDLSAEGLHLYSLNSIFATFQVKEEKRLIYSIEPRLSRYDVPTELKRKKDGQENHQAQGWTYVSDFGNDYYIYQAEEGTAAYQLSEKETAAFQKESVEKHKYWNHPLLNYTWVGTFLSYSVIQDIFYLMDASPYRLVNRYGIPFVSVLPFLFLLPIVRRTVETGKLQRAYVAGKRGAESSDWQDPRLRRKHVGYYVTCLCLICSIFISFIPVMPYVFGYNEKPMSEVRVQLHEIELAEIENHPDFYYVDRYFQRNDPADKESWWERDTNVVSKEWTIGAPTQYSYNQAGRIDGKVDAIGEPYAPVLWVYYKEFSFLVTPKEYLDSYLEQEWVAEEGYTELTDTPFDHAVLIEDTAAMRTELLLIKDNKMLEILYENGEADLTEHYELYLQALEEM